ncbi:MAG: hypothetical protein ACK4MR_06290, partial [Erythrobacter cryptus]
MLARPVLPLRLVALVLCALVAAAGLGLAARAAAPASLRVQVVDAAGLPVRDAVVELRSPRAPAGPIR